MDPGSQELGHKFSVLMTSIFASTLKILRTFGEVCSFSAWEYIFCFRLVAKHYLDCLRIFRAYDCCVPPSIFFSFITCFTTLLVSKGSVVLNSLPVCSNRVAVVFHWISYIYLM